MTGKTRFLTAVVLVGAISSIAAADGLIVPVSPEVRVQGSWAVKYHHVSIKVRDQVASVSIDQEFVNTGRGMIEVEYLFPVPPGAAIDSMTLLVNGKEFAARLLKADEARKIYEEIVRKKKDPALLEYAGFGLYRTRAFPLEPGKPARVVVTYKSICKKDNGLVEVWYPLNTEKFSARAIEDVKVTLDIRSKSDISAVYSPTHDLTVKRDPKDTGHVTAVYHEKNTLPTTDIQVFYREGTEAIGATMMTCKPTSENDGYFMMLVSPNPRLASTKVVPKDVVIVLDKSGSMSGEKIEQARKAAAQVLSGLNKEDRFNIIVYSDTVTPFFKGLVDAGSKVKEAMKMLDTVEAGGSTDIHEALQVAMGSWPIVENLNKASPVAGNPKYIIFLTDGLPTAGKTPAHTKEAKIIADTKAANKAGARLFAFGVGYDVNVRLLDRMVNDNGGKSDYVKPNEAIEGKISSLYNKIKNPVMTNVTIDMPGVKLYDMYPREIGDIFDGDQIVLLGRYRVKSEMKNITGVSRESLPTISATLVVKGLYEGKQRGFEYPVSVRNTVGGNEYDPYKFVEKLWAMRRVGWLLDQIQLHGKSEEVVSELVRLSLAYGIMTPYTSFLADETTDLSENKKLDARATDSTRELRKTSGATGQRGAKNRASMNQAVQVSGRSAPGATKGKQIGYSKKDSYEADEKEEVSGVRNVGNQAVYQRGKQWIASNAADVDLKKDKDKIEDIKRFSDKYFELTKANTTEENQILASQQEGEELIIRLRNQVYRIR